MRHIISFVILSLFILNIQAQSKYHSKTGYVSFYSHTVIEDITAVTENATGIIDINTGEVVITIGMADFEFEKKLMQEHFNENYIESEKYPNATFKGYITNNEKVDYTNKGSYTVNVEGSMNIHGVTQKLSTTGTIKVNKTGFVASAVFQLSPEDYDIAIPGVVRNKIATSMDITAEM